MPRSAAAIPLGTDHSGIFELLPAIFDLLSALNDGLILPRSMQ
jgi:hypothetical protein